MNEEELSEAMSASLPSRPDARSWADGARSKARNRRFAAAGAALVAVAVMITPFALQTGRDMTPPVILATPTPSPTVQPVALVPDACTDPAADAVPLVDDALPEGAERMWLCGGEDARTGQAVVGASDPLVAGVDDAVAAFNAMPVERGILSCAEYEPLVYAIIVEYPDGTHRTVQVSGCNDLRDATNFNDSYRSDGPGYLATLQELWAAERAETDFAYTGVEGLCDTSHASVHRPLDLADLTRVVACADLPDGTREVVRLPSGLTEEVLASIRTDARGWSSEIGIGAGPPSLVLLTRHGDPVSAFSYPLATGQDQGVNAFIWNDGSTNMIWTLPQDLQDDILDLVDAHVTSAQTIVPEPSTEVPEPSSPESAISGLDAPKQGWRWASRGDVAVQVPQEWGFSDYLRSDWCVSDPDGPTKPEGPYVGMSPGPVAAIACGDTGPEDVRMHLAFGAPSDVSSPTEIMSRTVGESGVSVVLEQDATDEDRALAEEMLATAVTFERDAAGCAPNAPFANATDRPEPWDITAVTDIGAVGLCRYTDQSWAPEAPNLEASRLLSADEAAELVAGIAAAPEGVSGNPNECAAGMDEGAGVVLRVQAGTDVHDVYLRVDGCGNLGWDDGLTRRQLSPACSDVFARAPIRWFGGAMVAAENCQP